MMNEAMKMENIHEYFGEIGKAVDKNVVMGYTDPRKRDYFFLGAFSAFKMKSYLIAFYSDEIILAGLTATGKFNEELIHLSKNDIQSIIVKKGIMQYKIMIQTKEEKIKLKCSKFIFNTPWQKENTTYLENQNWYIKELV